MISSLCLSLAHNNRYTLTFQKKQGPKNSFKTSSKPVPFYRGWSLLNEVLLVNALNGVPFSPRYRHPVTMTELPGLGWVFFTWQSVQISMPLSGTSWFPTSWRIRNSRHTGDATQSSEELRQHCYSLDTKALKLSLLRPWATFIIILISIF